MEKQTVRPAHIRRRHILARLLLSAAAVVILLPVVLTALYSFFSPGEIKAFMQTRGSFDAKSLMEIKLSPNMFSLSQYYKILIEDMTILRYFVNSAMYTAAILFGQALLIPAMAYALSRFRFRGRDALFFVVIMLMLLPFQVTMVPNVITLRGEYDAAQKELMELERKNGDVRLKRTEEIWVEAYDALAKSKEDCMTAQTQLEVAAKLAGVTLSGGRLPSGETDETLTAAQKAVDAAQAAQDEAQKKFNSANRLGISENVINYITQSRQLNEKLATTQEKITALDVMAQQARQVTAPHDGYIVEINVKAGDSYDGKTAALVISSESGDAVLRADTSKIEKKIDKGTQVTVKRDSDKTLTKKVTDSGVNEEGKRYIDVKLTDKDITNLGGGAALFSAAVEMTASYRASSSTTLLPASAVRGSGDSRYVYIVSEESNALGQRVLKVKKQDVKVLSEVGSTVSIQDDLSRQRVAYMEDRAISDGSEVMVYGE